MKRIVFAFLLLFLIFFTACNKIASPTINPEVLVTATPPSLPNSGEATLYGQVMHTQGYPIDDTIIRLAEVARGADGRGGAYILDMANSPATRTDANGYFSIQNVKAGEYVIVVGDVESTGTYEVITESNGQAKVWNLPADQATDIGILKVSVILPTPNPTLLPGTYPGPISPPYP
jgi:hypothetical protein